MRGEYTSGYVLAQNVPAVTIGEEIASHIHIASDLIIKAPFIQAPSGPYENIVNLSRV